jgi:hypothetical protein
MRYFLFVVVTLLLFACKNNQSSAAADIQKPDSLIQRSQMVRILTDVHLTEAALGFYKTKGEATKNLTSDYYNAVFSKYRISRKNFESNFKYYESNPDELIKIYEQVISNLEILKKQNHVEEE